VLRVIRARFCLIWFLVERSIGTDCPDHAWPISASGGNHSGKAGQSFLVQPLRVCEWPNSERGRPGMGQTEGQLRGENELRGNLFGVTGTGGPTKFQHSLAVTIQ
jgi:hypothetical protein